MSRFGAGNLRTLLELPKAADPPIDVRAELLVFHKQQYGASRMRLAIIGSEPIAELEKWARASFSAIPDVAAAGEGGGEAAVASAGEDGARRTEEEEELPEGRARYREWAGRTPYDAAWKRAYFIAPVAERRQLSLFFPAPPTQSEFRAKPAHFLSHLVGHEGPGSLLAVLKVLGWATELSAGVSCSS